MCSLYLVVISEESGMDAQQVEQRDQSTDATTMLEEANKLPGVAETVELMEAIEGLIPSQPATLVVTRYSTGGNLPDAHVG